MQTRITSHGSRITTHEFLLLTLAALAAGFALLASNGFAPVANSLTLVGLGLAELADLRGGLAHALLVDAGDRDHRVARLRIVGDRKVDAFARHHFDRVREADV